MNFSNNVNVIILFLLVTIPNLSNGQTVSLEEISFNYEPGNVNDAIAIRKDLSTNEITAPEYVTNIKNDEFAYIMGQGKPMVKVKIDGLDVNKNYSIKACVTSGNGFSNVSEFLAAGCGVSTNIFYFELENEVPNSVGKYTFTWQWEIITYPISSPCCTSTYTKTTTHTCYVIYDTPKDPEPIPRTTILSYACEWASGKSNENDISDDIMNIGFVNNYQYGGWPDLSCANLSSDFIRLVASVGVFVKVYRWGASGTDNQLDMECMRTIDLVSLNNPWLQAHWWYYHQWAETAQTQRDPSIASSFQGTWGEYEDNIFDYYTYNDTGGLLITQENEDGQVVGCESEEHRTYIGSLTVIDGWKGPNN